MGFLMLLAAFFVLRRMMWRGWRPRYAHRYSGRPWLVQMHYYRVDPRVPMRALSPTQLREHEMNALRRRYVADEIDVEEYERELDRVLRKH